MIRNFDSLILYGLMIKRMHFNRFAAQGHQLYTWYKCAGGHVYAINNCGEPQEKGKCFCGGEIGGIKHTLSTGNRRLESYQFSEKVGIC